MHSTATHMIPALASGPLDHGAFATRVLTSTLVEKTSDRLGGNVSDDKMIQIHYMTVQLYMDAFGGLKQGKAWHRRNVSYLPTQIGNTGGAKEMAASAFASLRVCQGSTMGWPYSFSHVICDVVLSGTYIRIGRLWTVCCGSRRIAPQCPFDGY